MKTFQQFVNEAHERTHIEDEASAIRWWNDYDDATDWKKAEDMYTQDPERDLNTTAYVWEQDGEYEEDDFYTLFVLRYEGDWILHAENPHMNIKRGRPEINIKYESEKEAVDAAERIFGATRVNAHIAGGDKGPEANVSNEA